MWHLSTYHVVQTNRMKGNAVPSHLQYIPCKPYTDRNGLHLTCACCSFVHLLYSVPLLLSAVLTSWRFQRVVVCAIISVWKNISRLFFLQDNQKLILVWFYRGVLRIIFIVVWHLRSLMCDTLLPMQRNSMNQAVRLWRKLALLQICACVWSSK